MLPAEANGIQVTIMLIKQVSFQIWSSNLTFHICFTLNICQNQAQNLLSHHFKEVWRVGVGGWGGWWHKPQLLFTEDRCYCYHFFATLNQYQELCESWYGRMGSLAAPNIIVVSVDVKQRCPWTVPKEYSWWGQQAEWPRSKARLGIV